ncbi:Zn(II)2Cys6 transcription factor [Fusarium albosuccineum]|uniref:Zn(II)2Cys6 transcription factor n=1 Tax=Fusarium albosuccineum TaxID=1237068 RepID=A0A8H4L511_9HYPO|nr:Zn(II)2Cys6 transcription factor [Fusarium albosuccineum]
MELDRVHAFVGNEDKTPEAVLAATLVLCNHSLLEFDLSLALFHLRAARALVKTIVSERQPSNELFVFLRNQVASLDVLACTTLFNPDLVEGAVLPEIKYGPVIFGDYLRIIHDITLRSLHSDDSGHFSDDFMCELEDRFELARASTLIAVGRLMDLPNTSYQHDVVLLVEAFQHAGLVYACKRLQGTETQQLEKHHCSKLFRLFRRFDNIGACLANLSWPIFVAGISSCGDAERTFIVTDMACRLASNSPFRYYANIPAFFKELRASPVQDWIALAREWENRGALVLAM